MSQEMIYGEKQAEQTFLEIIHTTFSHKLKNPLHSIVGQLFNMEDEMKDLRHLLSVLSDQQISSQMHILNQVY